MLEEVTQGIFFGNLDEDSSGTRSCDVRFPELEIGVKLKKLLKKIVAQQIPGPLPGFCIFSVGEFEV